MCHFESNQFSFHFCGKWRTKWSKISIHKSLVWWWLCSCKQKRNSWLMLKEPLKIISQISVSLLVRVNPHFLFLSFFLAFVCVLCFFFLFSCLLLYLSYALFFPFYSLSLSFCLCFFISYSSFLSVFFSCLRTCLSTIYILFTILFLINVRRK